jgi:hypothetical protein
MIVGVSANNDTQIKNEEVESGIYVYQNHTSKSTSFNTYIYKYIYIFIYMIVGVSASNDTQSKNEGLESGMDYFLFKPFAYKDLIHILKIESPQHVFTGGKFMFVYIYTYIYVCT